MDPPRHDWNFADWDVKLQNKAFSGSFFKIRNKSKTKDDAKTSPLLIQILILVNSVEEGKLLNYLSTH